MKVWRPPNELARPPRRIGHPEVVGLLLVDLRDHPDHQEVRRRFGAIADAPDGVEIEVRLPRPRLGFISLSGVLGSWYDLPTVTFTVIGHTAEQVRRAVRELKAEIERFPA